MRGTPVWLVVLSMDYCSRTFGVAPCNTTGEKCYNTYPTCKYKTAYANAGMDYKCTSADVPAPFDLAYPFVKSVKLLPTEIKTTLTVSGRVVVEFIDVPGTDVGIDPYLSTRAAFPNIPGTFWKRWLRRNANYYGRRIKIYEGWVGETEEQFDLRWVGTIETASYDRGVLKLECVDLLKDLSKIEIPPKLAVKLNENINDVQTSFTVTPNVDLPAASGTILIEEEIVTYETYTVGTGALTGVSRGQYGTIAAAHDANERIQPCKMYAKQNGFDLLKSMLLDDGGIDSGDVDTAAYDYHRDYPARDLDVGPTVVTEPTKLSVLYFELLELLNAKSWQNEANKITIARDVASIPLTTVASLSDADTIVHGSAKVDHNEKSRLSRVWLNWEKTVLGKVDEQASYGRTDVAASPDAEAAVNYGKVSEKKIFSRWLSGAGQQEELVSAFARNAAGRILVRNIEASPVISIRASLKDEGIKTGEHVSLSTDELVDQYGNPTNYRYQVIKRERGEKDVSLSLLRASTRKIGHAAPSGYATTYTNASEVDRNKYLFAAGSNGLMSNYDPGCFAY